MEMTSKELLNIFTDLECELQENIDTLKKISYVHDFDTDFDTNECYLLYRKMLWEVWDMKSKIRDARIKRV